MSIAIVYGTTGRVISQVLLTPGTYEVTARMAMISPSGTATMRIREAGTAVDETTLSTSSATMQTITAGTDLVVAIERRYDVVLEGITLTGSAVVESIGFKAVTA